MSILLLLGSALAAAPPVVAPAHVHEDTEARTPATLFADVQAHFDPMVASPSLGDRFACATGLVQELKSHWEAFTPAERAVLTDLLAPWKEDLLQVLPGLPPPPPGAGPSDTCWGAVGAYRYQTEHFSVEWDGGGIDQQEMEALADALETSWTQEVDVLGWRAPYKSDEYKMLVYVDDNGYSGAYTTVDYCNGASSAYVVTGDGIFYGDWFQDLAAHEFNHASQFAYGYGHEFYFWEATATYVEEYVFPEHDAWAQFIRGYTANPWIALSASSQSNSDIFSHMYAMAIFNFYLDEYVGGHALNVELWEYAALFPQEAYSLRVPEILEVLEHDFDAIYTGFVAANTVMTYEEGDLMGRISKMDSVHDLPLHGASERDTAPENLGQNYWRISEEAYDADEPDLKIHLEGALHGEWLVLLVGTSGDEVDRVVVAEQVDGEEGEETWEALMEGWGVHEYVWVIMSPTAVGYDSYSYAFDVWSQPAPEIVLAPEEEEESERAFLGSCSTSPVTPAAGGWVLGLFGVLVRRRR